MMPKKILLRVLIAFVLVCICAGSALAVFFYENVHRITVRPNLPSPSPSATATPKPHVEGFHELEPWAILLLGYGGGTHDGAYLTDSMLLVDIIPQQKHMYLISLPRDLWTPLPLNGDQSPSVYYKINAAYAFGLDTARYQNRADQYKGPAGGGQLAKYATQLVTGIPVDNFVGLDFSGFRKTIDVLGGVDVKVEKTFDDPLYPIEGKEADSCGHSPQDVAAITATMSATQMENAHLFPCRYEQLHFDAGVTHMDGETALKYVRSRHATTDGGDFNRTARQRNLLVAVKNRVFSLSFFPKILPFVSSLSNDVRTDLTFDDMKTFLQYKDVLSTYKITSIALTNQNVFKQTISPDRQDIVIPKDGIDQWVQVQAWIKLQMAE